MYQANGKPTIFGDFVLLLVSIMINSLGNALTVSLHLGSAMWTASAVNLSHLFPVSLGNMLLLEGVAVVAVNAVLLHHADWHRMLGNFCFMIPFSYLVSGLASLMVQSGINNLPLISRVLLDIVGIMLIAAGISIYQRINLILHPNDDLMQIIRFRFLHGNAILAQLVAYATPITIIIMTLIVKHTIWAVNIGTLVALIFQGSFIATSDKWVFRKLKHQRL